MRQLRRNKLCLAYIKIFKDVMQRNFSEEELNLFNQNIKSLKIFKLNFIEEFIFRYDAMYDSMLNKIVLGKDFTDIFHELFHLSSTDFSREEMCCGFVFNADGVALNEGYTEILSKRYFNSIGEGYKKQIKYAQIIEDIVSKDVMEHLYLTADFQGLVDELRKYASYKEVIDFIINMDKDKRLFFLEHTEPEKKIIEFLLKIYINFLNGKLSRNEIDIKEYETMLINLICKINIKINNEYVITPELVRDTINSSVKVKKRELN